MASVQTLVPCRHVHRSVHQRQQWSRRRREHHAQMLANVWGRMTASTHALGIGPCVLQISVLSTSYLLFAGCWLCSWQHALALARQAWKWHRPAIGMSCRNGDSHANPIATRRAVLLPPDEHILWLSNLTTGLWQTFWTGFSVRPPEARLNLPPRVSLASGDGSGCALQQAVHKLKELAWRPMMALPSRLYTRAEVRCQCTRHARRRTGPAGLQLHAQQEQPSLVPVRCLQTCLAL